MFSDQSYEKTLSVRERNLKLLLETVTYIAIKERVTFIITMETVMCIMHCNQSINQSINVFQGKIQTVQFTNIYKHILFLHDIHMIFMIMKTN